MAADRTDLRAGRRIVESAAAALRSSAAAALRSRTAQDVYAGFVHPPGDGLQPVLGPRRARPAWRDLDDDLRRQVVQVCRDMLA